jgi:hypothetical protein
MSATASTASTVSVVLSDKFKKELEKFFSWAKESYTIKDVNEKKKDWSMSLLSKFEEPGRNKLEAYIKNLLQNYIISNGDMDIEDAKLLAKEFKEKSGKSKKSDDEKSEEPKKVKKTETQKKETKTKKTKSEVETEGNVRLDMTLDTSETYNVETLDFWTEELEQVFGKPKKTGDDDQEHTWEWKVEVDGDIYSIYNWNEYGESYEESTWYLGSTVENKKTIKALNDYIWGMIGDENIEETMEVEVEQAEKGPTMEELFGEDDEDELEIDLDGIDDM